jgi:CBS domain containing-hemolysin-like protein
LNVDDSLLSLRDKFIETGFSKILIYRESIDYIIGYVHSSELFKRPDGIKNILMPVSIVPESMPADDVLEQLISQKRSMAVVVDEFGGTAGVITMEDVVEEIFGEIEDEHDKQGLTEKKTGHNTYQLAARLEVDYLNEEYKFNIPESEDYETLAGYIISVAERIPEQDETIRTERFDLKILDETDNRIELVELRVKSGD